MFTARITELRWTREKNPLLNVVRLQNGCKGRRAICRWSGCNRTLLCVCVYGGVWVYEHMKYIHKIHMRRANRICKNISVMPHTIEFTFRAEFLDVTWVSSRPQVIDFWLFGIFRSSLRVNCPLAVPWSQGTDRSTLELPWLLLGFLDNCRHDIIYRRFKLNF